MDEPFEIPVIYKGEEWLFPARLLQHGYTHRFQVEVNGYEVLFEPDEEQNYRAMISPEKLHGINKMDIELLKAIAGAIEIIVK
jgi:hypothetical protein